ncbi:MAG: hypothetical protein U0793_29940 [Gemmataceae bacterium]
MVACLCSSPCLRADETPTLAVVRTFGDLMKQPLLVLKNGAKVRVGVERLETTQHSAFLVYALSETPEYEGGGLGPVRIEVTPKNEGPKDRVKIRTGASRSAKRGPLFFATAAHVRHAGEYDLEIRDENARVLAAATIRVAGEDAEPWHVFRLADPGELLTRDARHKLILGPTRPATPHCDGHYSLPLPLDQNGRIRADVPLPRWNFANAEPALSLQATLKSLALHGDDLHSFLPSENLLFRVRVNGKVAPALLKTAEFADVLMKVPEEAERKALRVDLDFDPRAFGARRGDRIALQLVYCPDGWRNADERFEKAKRGIEKGTPLERRLPRVSQWTELIVP